MKLCNQNTCVDLTNIQFDLMNSVIGRLLVDANRIQSFSPIGNPLVLLKIKYWILYYLITFNFVFVSNIIISKHCFFKVFNVYLCVLVVWIFPLLFHELELINLRWHMCILWGNGSILTLDYNCFWAKLDGG